MNNLSIHADDVDMFDANDRFHTAPSLEGVHFDQDLDSTDSDDRSAPQYIFPMHLKNTKDTSRINPRTGYIIMDGSPKDNGWKRTADIDTVLLQRATILAYRPSGPPPSDDEIRSDSISQLDYISQQATVPDGLGKIMIGVVKILEQKWVQLVVHTGNKKGQHVINGKRTWSRHQIIGILTKICCDFWREVCKIKFDGDQLDCADADAQFLPLVNDIAGLGEAADAEGRIVIELNEWETVPMVALLDNEEMFANADE